MPVRSTLSQEAGAAFHHRARARKPATAAAAVQLTKGNSRRRSVKAVGGVADRSASALDPNTSTTTARTDYYQQLLQQYTTTQEELLTTIEQDHQAQEELRRILSAADKLDFTTAYDCTATAKAAVQWVCFPSLLSSAVERAGRRTSSTSTLGLATMPCRFSKSTTDVVMVDQGGSQHDIVKMDTSPPASVYPTGVDLFRVDVVLPQPSLPKAPGLILQPSYLPNQRSTAAGVKCPLKDGCPDNWSWNRHDKSHEVRLHGTRSQSAHFHPNWSNGTAGVRGSKVLNVGRHYWEVKISQRVFGTSMMFGISTKKARLHVDAFVNLLGEDDQSWGLSHKGLLWHDGKWRQYTQPFRENEATVIGLLYDGNQGTLTCYKDGICLGVAFSGLNKVEDELFPTVCSTAAKTEMSLGATMRGFTNLQDRCRAAIISRLQEGNSIDSLPLPNRIKEFVKEGCH